MGPHFQHSLRGVSSPSTIVRIFNNLSTFWLILKCWVNETYFFLSILDIMSMEIIWSETKIPSISSLASLPFLSFVIEQLTIILHDFFIEHSRIAFPWFRFNFDTGCILGYFENSRYLPVYFLYILRYKFNLYQLWIGMYTLYRVLKKSILRKIVIQPIKYKIGKRNKDQTKQRPNIL